MGPFLKIIRLSETSLSKLSTDTLIYNQAFVTVSFYERNVLQEKATIFEGKEQL